jgi:hypothetical protein
VFSWVSARGRLGCTTGWEIAAERNGEIATSVAFWTLDAPNIGMDPQLGAKKIAPFPYTVKR